MGARGGGGEEGCRDYRTSLVALSHRSSSSHACDETQEVVLNYVTASLILPAGETCETRYHDAFSPPPSAPARRATHPHPVRAGHARRPTLVQASLDDGKKMGSGEGEGWWGLLNFFKRRKTEPVPSLAGEGEERELGRKGRGEGMYRMRRRYSREGY